MIDTDSLSLATALCASSSTACVCRPTTQPRLYVSLTPHLPHYLDCLALTLLQLGLEDDDEIEVMTEQIGGSL